MKLELQKLRKGTKYESYRLAIPRSIILSHEWEDIEFDVKIDKGKIILTPS